MRFQKNWRARPARARAVARAGNARVRRAGREYRSEFHINPSDEVMLMLRGTMNLHYRTSEGKEEIAVLNEGSIIYNAQRHPALAALSPRRVSARDRAQARGRRIDAFQWFCPGCDFQLHEETFAVSDYALDPVSKAYAAFFDSEEHRTCGSCGEVMPGPAVAGLAKVR